MWSFLRRKDAKDENHTCLGSPLFANILGS